MPALSFRILSVDLERRASEVMIVAEQELRDYLGGATLAARLLYPSLRQDLDSLGPDAPLLFLTGPLTGTTGPAVGRFVICAKSPATGQWGESNIGGYFGPELRAAGYDGLLITGSSQEPIYLWLLDGQLHFRPAAHLWGQADTYETQATIRAEVEDPKARICCIGVAGERGIPYALVMCDHGRVAGRTGMGAVMGAKGLKAVAVRGHSPVRLIQEEAFKASRRVANLALREDNFSRAARGSGTAAGLDYWDYLGSMPKRYFTGGPFPGADRLSGSTMAETILSGVSTCHGCVIACGRVVRLADGEDRKGPEYETIVGFGPNLLIQDLAAVTRLGELCDRYGMDTISLSNTIGLAFLMYQEGLLKSSDTDGEKLRWGDEAVVERLVHRTARREGFGDLLARGARDLADHFGAFDMAAQVNSLEVAYHDPRGASGMALVYATSPRGACHNQGDYFMVDTWAHTAEAVGVRLLGRHAGAEKASNVAKHQDWRTVGNSLVLCQFANVDPQLVVRLTNEATGFDYTLEDLMQAGERGWNLKRLANHRLGLTRANDRLPKHLLKPLPDGGSAGYVPPFAEMLAAYYDARGWDQETGRPTPERLRSLCLGEYVADLWGERV